MSLTDVFEVSVKLREIHNTMKGFRRDAFAEDVAEIEPLIALNAEKMKVDFFTAAIRLAKNAPNEMQTLLILATAVKVKLRDDAAVCTEGRS